MMLAKYKVGDRVRIVKDEFLNNHSRFNVGDTFTIAQVSHQKGGDWLREKEGETTGVHESIVELLQTNTVELPKDFVLEAHSAACQTWQKKIEKQLPELFKGGELEAGKWYKTTFDDGRDNVLFCLQKIRGKSLFGYGFNVYENSLWIGDTFWATSDVRSLAPASDKEVKQALEKETIRRYGEDWKNVRIRECVKHPKSQGLNLGVFQPVIEVDESEMWNKNACIFYKGNWAEIIEEPKKEEDDVIKVGDTVELVANEWCYDKFVIGKRYKVESVNDIGGVYLEGGVKGDNYFFPREIRKVKSAPTELTLEQIAEKFNIPVSSLRIKE